MRYKTAAITRKWGHRIMEVQVVQRLSRGSTPRVSTKFKMKKFKDMAIGEEFRCYGDTYSNYDYPRWIRCKKVGEAAFMDITDGPVGVQVLVDPNESFDKF
jgi:hypothetical protein